ncbi:Eukaryotic aspartyl protease [Aphelenchoides besseyi]|nr:Eukaryotic aspartyl protease [Aphelenchoides besseyi]
MKPPFIKAYEDGLVDSLFTVYLQHKGYEDINNGGQITLGAIESELCDKSTLFWIPLTSATYWQFHLTSMTFNGAVIPFDGADSISDTGTSYLVIPSTVFQPIYEQISQMKPQRSPSLLSLDCNTKLTLDLMINGKQFRLTEKHLLIQESKGSTDCWVTIDEGENESLWILGDPFIRAYCNVYDYGNTRLGLMTPKSPS